MYILGLSSMRHDPAAALIGDQGVIAAIEEGKLTRTRLAGGIPRAAIQFCLERGQISMKDLDRIAIAGHTSVSPVDRQSITNVLNELGKGSNSLRLTQKNAKSAARSIRNFDHHLCHAASAFFASGLDHALIVTLDERGDGRCGSVSVGGNTHICEVESIAFPNSLAWFYSQITRLIGFRPHCDEHKTQWLSLVGEPTFADFFLDVLRRVPNGSPHLNRKYFRRRYGSELSFSDEFYRRLCIQDESHAPIEDPLRANIAASLHKACEVILCDWLEALRRKTKTRSLCLAGGLFLNPLLVAAVESNTKFATVFVQPAAGNEGTALGAAWLAWNQKPRPSRIPSAGNPYWGPEYSNEAIKGVLDNCKASYRWCDSDNDKINETVMLLQSGKIVAWYQGAAEFGPRALGNRSLLASPWSAYVKENLNEYVKHRESFRPFALAMPEEDCGTYFEYTANSHFLTTMATANEKGRNLLENLPPGFLLKGNLVRLHVVASTENPLFWKLLKRSGQNAPAPLLVNTSFNLFGEPLVVRPRDAVRSYFCSGADALVAGSFLLKKK
ncbi:MAG TPA: carbamoyltransferase C-terminal domain-containing protein [Candidatus Binatus sp.]|jgi:carbamoyltransferase|nr:carbamoyltransferase C-terminal domain-containing protein [Candidatus Binatus sp.]